MARGLANWVLALSGTLFFASSSARAELFADDFESGTLLTSASPAGKWALQNVAASCSIAAATGAAKRGNFGLAIVDGASISGSGFQGDVVRSIGTLTNVHARFWFRLAAVGTMGTVTVAQIRLGSTPFLEVKLNLAASQLEMGGVDNLADYHSAVTQFTPLLNTWYLFELQLANVGTDNATLKIWIDGIARGQVGNNYQNLDVDTLSLGESVANDRMFAGTLHFDDYRVDSAPMASRFAMTVASNASVNAGDCVPMNIGLRDSINGAPAKAPYEVQGALSSGGAGSFYSDAACSFSVSTIKLPAGSSVAATAYYRPTASGISSLSVSQADFLPATAQVQVAGSAPAPTPSTPDPSQSEDPERLDVSSSCSASGSGLASLWGYLALSLRLLQRRRLEGRR